MDGWMDGIIYPLFNVFNVNGEGGCSKKAEARGGGGSQI
jgi:hypothetical protein